MAKVPLDVCKAVAATEEPDSGSPSPDRVLPARKERESSRIKRYLMTILRGLQLQLTFL